MNKLTLFCALLLTIVSSCKKVVTDVLNKEVTRNFHIDLWVTNKITFESLPAYTNIMGFDKRDYPGVYAITFAAGLGVSNEGDTCYARLFNVTDNVEVANSILYSTTGHDYGTFKLDESNNIFYSLPDKRIDLAVQIRTNTGKMLGQIVQPYLTLTRR